MKLVRVGWTIRDELMGGSWEFDVPDECDDPEALIRQAIAAGFQRIEREHGQQHDYPMNWGDAVNELDDEDWARFGIVRRSAPTPQHVLYVDHDETVYAWGGEW